MTKHFTLLLFIGLAFGQNNQKSAVGVGLILYNGQKTELINVGEKVVMLFNELNKRKSEIKRT